MPTAIPTKAALGFARGQGVDVADLYRKRTLNGGLYVFATKRAAGVAYGRSAAGTLLPQLVLRHSFSQTDALGLYRTALCPSYSLDCGICTAIRLVTLCA